MAFISTSQLFTFKPVPIPSELGSTTLPKQTLSYRWIINNANIFLWKKNQSLSLRSPRFSVNLPSTNLKSSWSLLIEHEEVSQYYQVIPNHRIYLCHENVPQHSQSRILVSECKFSFLNPETYEAKYSLTAPTEDIVLSMCAQDIEYNKLMGCIFSGTLTVQVSANLLCINDSNAAVSPKCKVPLDTIRNEMHSLYKEEVYTDATVKCGGKEFKVHRAVLGSQSPVFKAMFQADMKEKRSRVIDISDITPAVMSDLVAYLYTGTAPNVSTLAGELLNAANKYELPRLFTMCENELKMKIKVVNVVDTLLLADLHSAVHLKKACLNFIRLHSADVHKTSKWEYLKDNLDQYKMLVFEAL